MQLKHTSQLTCRMQQAGPSPAARADALFGKMSVDDVISCGQTQGKQARRLDSESGTDGSRQG